MKFLNLVPEEIFKTTFQIVKIFENYLSTKHLNLNFRLISLQSVLYL